MCEGLRWSSLSLRLCLPYLFPVPYGEATRRDHPILSTCRHLLILILTIRHAPHAHVQMSREFGATSRLAEASAAAVRFGVDKEDSVEKLRKLSDRLAQMEKVRRTHLPTPGLVLTRLEGNRGQQEDAICRRPALTSCRAPPLPL